MFFLLGKPPRLLHQREGSSRHRVSGFHEPLTANPSPHGSVYPGTGEHINYSPELAHGAQVSSLLQPAQWGWDSLPGAGRRPPSGPGCQAQPVRDHCLAWLWGRCPHPCIPGDGSEPFCSHQLSRAMLSPHAASLEGLRDTRARGSWGPISATTGSENRSQNKVKGLEVALGACHHS